MAESPEARVMDTPPHDLILPDGADDSHACCVCLETFSSASGLALHQTSAQSQTALLCRECGKACACCQDFILHQAQHSSWETAEEARCEGADSCNFELCSAVELSAEPKSRSPISDNNQSTDRINTYFHTSVSIADFSSLCGETVHKTFDMPPSGVSLSHPDSCCNICSKSFDSTHQLKLHNREGQHFCHVCEKSFVKKSALVKHMVIHTSVKLYSCEVCGKRFSVKSNMNRHMLIHSKENSYSCDFGDKAFGTSSNFARHMLKHTEGEFHLSSPCSEAFHAESDLSEIMLNHRHNRQPRNLSGIVFARKSRLSDRMSTHKGRTAYSCDLCNKTFAYKASVARHMLTHTGQKPHPCSLCSKAFARKSTLTIHMLTHSRQKPHSCSLCSKAFAVKSTLTRHMLTHTGQKPHSCSVCDKTFAQKSNLTQHMLTHRVETSLVSFVQKVFQT